MHAVDYAMLGFTAMHQLITLGVVVHLVWRRDWPPYVTKNVTLVSSFSFCQKRYRRGYPYRVFFGEVMMFSLLLHSELSPPLSLSYRFIQMPSMLLVFSYIVCLRGVVLMAIDYF